MTLLIALAVLTHPVRVAAGLDAKVTLTSTGTVSALLGELSTQAATKLDVSDRRGKEILIVSLKNVPLAEAMERVAWATFGRWEKGGDGYRLVADTGAERDSERDYVRRVSDIAKSEIAKLQARTLDKGLRPPQLAPADQAKLGRDLPAAPEHRALVRALGAIKPESLVPTSPEAWCTFSNLPTPAQMPIGSQGEEIVRAYNAERAEINPSFGAVKATRIVLSGDFSLRGGQASISFYDAEGKPVTTDGTSANMEPADRPWLLPPSTLLDAIPANEPVPLSAESQFFSTPASPGLFTPTREYLDGMPEAVERLKNPERLDPLGTFTADVWVGAATRTGRNLVANVDDRYFVPFWSGKPPSLRDALCLLWQTGAKVEDGWLTVRPDIPTPRECHRIDRAALGRYARTAFTSAFSAFATTGAVAATADGNNGRWVLLDYTKWVKPEGPMVDFNFQWEAMRLFGSLPSSAQRDWLEGRPLAVSTLSEASRRALRAWTWPMENSYANLSQQPTVRFPNGLPDHGWLRAELQTERGFFTLRLGDDGKAVEAWSNLDQLAQYLNTLEKFNPSARKLVRFVEGAKVSVRLFPDFGPDDRIYGTVINGASPERDAYVSWENLPDETRQRIAEAQERLRPPDG